MRRTCISCNACIIFGQHFIAPSTRSIRLTQRWKQGQSVRSRTGWTRSGLHFFNSGVKFETSACSVVRTTSACQQTQSHSIAPAHFNFRGSLFISPPFQIHSAANGLRWSLLSIIHGWLTANPGYVNNAPRHSVRDVRYHRWVCCGSRVVESSISNELLGQNKSRVVLLISTSYGLPADKASLDLSLTLCPARTNKSRALCPSWPFNTS